MTVSSQDPLTRHLLCDSIEMGIGCGTVLLWKVTLMYVWCRAFAEGGWKGQILLQIQRPDLRDPKTPTLTLTPTHHLDPACHKHAHKLHIRDRHPKPHPNSTHPKSHSLQFGEIATSLCKFPSSVVTISVTSLPGRCGCIEACGGLAGGGGGVAPSIAN